MSKRNLTSIQQQAFRESLGNLRVRGVVIVFLASLMLCTLFGCQIEAEKTNASSDANAFNKIFALDVAFESITWEMFDTPEYTGGIPGPTDFVTLVAQIEPPNDAKFEDRPLGVSIWIAPESSRPWLDMDFRNFLERSKSKTIDISRKEDCRKLTGILRRTSKPINGFMCKSGKKILVYIKVADYTINMD
jgi:hypothetical protein